MFGRIHLSAALIGAGTAVLLGIAPAGAAEIDDLKAKVEALEKKVGNIEATSVSISGYVKGASTSTTATISARTSTSTTATISARPSTPPASGSTVRRETTRTTALSGRTRGSRASG